MPFPHQHLAQTISDQMNVLAAQLKTRTRASQNDANHWLESVMARFFNALFGWDLVNLNADQPNFPAADLGDRKRRIAMQITNQDAASKITETAKKAEVHQLGEAFDRLILFFLLPAKPAMPRSFVQPPAGPAIECWDITDLLKQMAELLDQNSITAAAAVLEKELGHQSASKEPPPSNLPGGYIGQTFVGREQFLKDLRTSLLKQTHTTAITQRPAATVTEGLGGLGKTHVAVEYADRHRDEYKALLFVSGDTPQRLQTSLAALCDVPGLHLNDNLPPEEAARANIALHWLATHPGWLLIVDNVDADAAALALREHFNHLRSGHVLITSRLHNWSNNVDPLDLSVLSQEDATDLLLQLTNKHRRKAADDEAKVLTLAELMEGLPLALHQAAGYINEQGSTFAEYLAIYKDKAAELLNWSNDVIIPYERPDKSVPRPVLITWKTSFEQLDDGARFWLLVFSHFAPDPIPEFLLDDKPNTTDEVKTRHRTAKKSLSQAGKFKLITRYDDPPRFKIHRLVQEVTRISASAEERAAAVALGIQLMDEGCPGDPQDVRTWKRWNPLQPHARAVCLHAPDEPAPGRLTWLLSCLSLLLNTKSLYTQAEPLTRRALQIDETSYGPDHPIVASRLNNLSTLLQDMNRLEEAEPVIRRALQIDEVSYGPDHPDVARDLNNLAQLLQDTNRLEEAESLMRRGLSIEEKIKGPMHPDVATQLNNLAQLLRDTNRVAEAEPLMARVVSIFETAFGKNHPDVAAALNNLATLLQDTNRLAEAEPVIRRALQIGKDSYGPDHTKVAGYLNNLAQLLKATNRLSEAEPLMRQALEIDEASYGPEHPNVARDLNNLALLLQETNRLAEAESLLRRAWGIVVRRLGLDHPNCQLVGISYMHLLQALELPVAEIKKRLREAIGGEQERMSSTVL